MAALVTSQLDVTMSGRSLKERRQRKIYYNKERKENTKKKIE
jgi:hypothetical protein